MRANKIIPCPGCSHLVTMVPDDYDGYGWWGVCPHCDGMIGDRVSSGSIRRRLGPLTEWDTTTPTLDGATCRYFDVLRDNGAGYRASRTHGWYNPVNGRIVQLG